MAESYSNRDLDLIPDINFTFVEKYVTDNTKSSGERHKSKGHKYFSENYIHDLTGKSFYFIEKEPIT